jgi:hypothetical protein
MGFSNELAALNQQLAGRGCKARIEQRKNSLTLRATLPPKPGALTLSSELRSRTFAWSGWQPSEASPIKEKELVTRTVFEEVAQRLHSEKYANAPERGAEAWRKRWATALNKLPTQGKLTMERLLAVIEDLPPATSVRRETGLIWGMVARKLGMDPAPLRVC